MNFIRKQVKLKNNKQLFHVQQYICCVWWISTVASHLSLGHWRQDGIRVGDNRCTGERTIPLYTVFYHWPGQPHIMHWNPISHALWVYSLLHFLELHFFFQKLLLGVIVPFQTFGVIKTSDFKELKLGISVILKEKFDILGNARICFIAKT